MALGYKSQSRFVYSLGYKYVIFVAVVVGGEL